jgi:hypothetical protein
VWFSRQAKLFLKLLYFYYPETKNYMSRNYKFLNPEGVYFVSFAVIEWLDVFIRNEYKNILLDSLHYCQKEKGMEIFAWPR